VKPRPGAILHGTLVVRASSASFMGRVPLMLDKM
jgi:hypothetical protein